ncbi:XrtA system polysaccharide deacetylase [Candidatus Laterigemmans baculatus]|uniref:XrtA system polysaccharide deacetylase n=1 Tax=Candidatus Laterigemmans baculatus TaxID=2770505 RepID=UPI0013DC5728|nr:XrtA system polysaccharide deacetylase [Candidatus Laterigemmans baculatus]
MNRAPLEPLTVNALTVDVEDYFQVSAFDGRVCRSTWDKLECRVEANTDRLLSIFDEADVRATFFVLGWVADRYPALLRRIAASGHEIGSHGYWHRLVYDLTPDEFAQDLLASREAIATACGVKAIAYRAPSFSIVEKSLWALSILAQHGFKIDSSIFPICGHDRYGVPTANKQIHDLETPQGTLCEFPPSAWTRGRMSVPIGGGYFRLFPLSVTLQAIRAVRREGRPAMFYIHPWEIDPWQPRIRSIGLKNKFRHYVGIARTERRLRRLLILQPFGPLTQVVQAVHAV